MPIIMALPIWLQNLFNILREFFVMAGIPWQAAAVVAAAIILAIFRTVFVAVR